jgi:hypothetical protein
MKLLSRVFTLNRRPGKAGGVAFVAVALAVALLPLQASANTSRSASTPLAATATGVPAGRTAGTTPSARQAPGSPAVLAAPRQAVKARQKVIWAGVRESHYGVREGHLGYYPNPCGWTKAMRKMSSYSPGSRPVGVWLVGEVDFDHGGMILEFPKPRGKRYSSLYRFSSKDQHEADLNYFDRHGIKVWLQLEPGHANIPTLIDLVLNRYQHHRSVMGLGIDIEWIGKSSENGHEAKVTDAQAKAWEARVKAHNSHYTLFLKHYDRSYFPRHYRGRIVFIDDSLGFTGFNSFLAEMKAFARQFYPSRVLFQYGYQEDRQWWRKLGRQPMKRIGDKLAAQTRQQMGLIWVDFSLKGELPTKC